MNLNPPAAPLGRAPRRDGSMGRRAGSVAVAAAMLLQLGACATTSGETSQTTQGAAIGALAGGVLGAIVGGDTKSIAIGAAAGAAVGALVGHYQDKQVASRAEAARRYADANTRRLEVEGASNQPAQIAAGGKVNSEVRYTVLAPQEGERFQVTESRSLVRGKDSFPLSKRQVDRAQGSHQSAFEFTLPKDIERGDYVLVTTLAAGGVSRSAQAPLRIV